MIQSSDVHDLLTRLRSLRLLPGLDQIIVRVGQVFEVDKHPIVPGRRGVIENNIPPWVLTYLCGDMARHKLSHIAEHFGLKKSAVFQIR